MEQMEQYVITLLKRYNGLKKEIEALEFEMENIRASVPDEMIDAMQLSTPNGERVSGGAISDRTPEIALTYIERFSLLTTQAIAEINIRLAYLGGIVRRLEHSIDMLEAHQASIIREYYFERYSWRELQELKGISFKTLIKYRNDGIAALAERYAALARLGVLEDLDSDYNTSTTKLQ